MVSWDHTPGCRPGAGTIHNEPIVSLLGPVIGGGLRSMW